MEVTSRRRWLTVLMDGVMEDIGGPQKGVQMVVGAGYDVRQFLNDIAGGVIKLKADNVALLLGNEQIKPGVNVNLGKQVERLIQQIWISRPTAEIFVSGVLPKLTQETLTESLVMKVNYTVASMCRRLNKYGKNRVYYMPLHQHLLEKWSHKDVKSGKMRKTTRIIQPHGKFYRVGTDNLNKTGADMIMSRVMDFVRGKQQPNATLMDRPGLIVQIENPEYSRESRVSTPSMAGKSDKVKIPPNGGGHRQEPKVGSGVGNQGAVTTAKSDGSQRGKVSRMVDQWEKLSQGPGGDDLDLELGGESVVRVDLGDQPAQ